MQFPSERRPTLRDVAAVAGVSHMTVSRVVNGIGGVASSTVQRVRDAIAKTGYRPDPALSALTGYRQRGGVVRPRQSVLAFLDCDGSAYSQVVLDGAREEAWMLGYTVHRVEMAQDVARQRRLCRALFHAGVRGLLFGPSAKPWKFEGWGWNEFAAVSLGALNHEPALHSVAMDYFDGAMTGYGVLGKQGCKRIGLVVDPVFEARTGNHWLGGYCAAAQQAGRPVLCAGKRWDGRRLAIWLRKEAVDGILTIHPTACEAARRAGIPVAMLNDFVVVPGVPYLKLDPREIGVEGARLLHHHVLRREFGLPVRPKRIALRGEWMADATGSTPVI